VITRDIFQDGVGVRWADVVELDDAKRLLHEAVVMPVKCVGWRAVARPPGSSGGGAWRRVGVM